MVKITGKQDFTNLEHALGYYHNLENIGYNVELVSTPYRTYEVYFIGYTNQVPTQEIKKIKENII